MAGPSYLLTLLAAAGSACAQAYGQSGSNGRQSLSANSNALPASSASSLSYSSSASMSNGYSDSAGGVQADISPPYNYVFDFPLPIPPVATPVYVVDNLNGQTFEYYQSNITKFQKKIYPNLGPANLVGYNGTAPGPTYCVQRGRRVVKRFLNNNDLSSTVHLHGSATRAAWDGWADDAVLPGQFKDYFYPNTQSARTLWYHDHADHHTSVDAYYGQNGFHIIDDVALDGLDLPAGDYDVPLEIVDRQYQANGDLISPANELVNFYGDVIHVNGQPWPYMAVEPRKYRLRMLNPGLSRPYLLYLNNDQTSTRETFSIIASDCGLFPSPISADNVAISPGERYEIVIDFAKYVGQNLTIMNDNINTIPQYSNTDKVMRFVVGSTVKSMANNNLPANTGVTVPFPPNRDVIDHVFDFERGSNGWTINGVNFDDVNSRVLAKPQQGTVERWQLNYRGGPGVHPVHIHLVNFVVVSRTGGSRGVLPYESAGLKDVVLMEPGENLEVIAWYGPWNGLYQFHCHNLIHEDHEMMDVLNVTALAALGYADTDVDDFSNPLNAKYQAKDYADSYYTPNYILNTLLPDFANSHAYDQEKGLLNAIADYYTTAGYGLAASATMTAAGNTPTQNPINGGYSTAANGQLEGHWTQGSWESWYSNGMGFTTVVNPWLAPTEGVPAVSIAPTKGVVSPAATAAAATLSNAAAAVSEKALTSATARGTATAAKATESASTGSSNGFNDASNDNNNNNNNHGFGFGSNNKINGGYNGRWARALVA